MRFYEDEALLLSELGLSAERINGELQRRGVNMSLSVSYETQSTSLDARRYYEETGRSGALFVADGQTEGRGRRGRSFVSTHGVGIYMSILVRPEGAMQSLTAITTMTAVAVCRAIERVTGLHAEIKWVNDIFYKGKKLGGILTEGVLSADMKTAEYVIVGIGLNVLSTELPDEIRDIAISLEAATGRKYDRGLLVAEITAEFMSALSRLGSSDIIEEYRRRSFLVGREITVHKLNSSYPARVLGIGDDTSLRIRLADGSVESLITGEVSVREK